MRKQNYLLLVLCLIIGIVVGNRVFNHLSAWMGLFIIVVTILFTIYKFIKLINNEKND